MAAPSQQSIRQGIFCTRIACFQFRNVQAWEEGGYSDDLTVASKCTEQGLVIYCPSYAIFPQW